jgi:L-fuculose-phosphate aldolase
VKVYDLNNIKAILKEHSRRAFDLGLVWGTSGNMSMRKDAKSFFITASGKSLGDVTVRDMPLCRMDKDKPNKASMEWRLHGEIYRNRKDVNAVFHSQPTYSTLIACIKDKKINTAIIPESIAYLKNIGVVPYCHAGSVELAEKCGEGAKKADLLLLENHGVVAFGSSIEDAVNKTMTLEFLCRLIVLSRSANMDLKSIPLRQVSEFLKLLAEGKKV